MFTDRVRVFTDHLFFTHKTITVFQCIALHKEVDLNYNKLAFISYFIWALWRDVTGCHVPWSMGTVQLWSLVPKRIGRSLYFVNTRGCGQRGSCTFITSLLVRPEQPWVQPCIPQCPVESHLTGVINHIRVVRCLLPIFLCAKVLWDEYPDMFYISSV